jgi:hypothetical protein
MPRSVEFLSPEPSAQTLRRIGADTAITKARGEMALLCSAMRAEPSVLAAGIARARRHLEAAERHLTGRDG